jgi:hypothetical protein
VNTDNPTVLKDDQIHLLERLAQKIGVGFNPTFWDMECNLAKPCIAFEFCLEDRGEAYVAMELGVWMTRAEHKKVRGWIPSELFIGDSVMRRESDGESGMTLFFPGILAPPDMRDG